jgi:hypothetical protein
LSKKASKPFIAHQEHGLGEVERGKARIDGKGDDAVGARHLVIHQPPALAAEQDAGLSAAAEVGDDLLGRRLRTQHGLGLVMGTGRGGEEQVDVGNGLGHGVEQLDMVNDMVGARRSPLGGNIGPAVARIDQAQARQREIAHGASGHADILAKLRLDQDDHGAREVKAALGLVGAAHGLVAF